MNEMHNYSMDKQRAINELREMNKRATKTDGTAQKAAATTKASPASKAFSVLPLDSDTLIILALILILSQDNTDKLLLLALAYILS